MAPKSSAAKVSDAASAEDVLDQNEGTEAGETQVKSPMEIEAEIVGLIDTVGTLDAKLKAAVAKIEPDLKAARERLMELVATDLTPQDTLTKKGTKFVLELGACANKRTITDKAVLVALLGEELFVKLANVTLKDCDDYLTPEQREKCIASEQNGARSFKVKPIGK